MPITVYLDTNMYRYIATKELTIDSYGDVKFGFSTAHFDDILTNKNNECVIDGIKVEKAVEIASNDDGSYVVDGPGVYLDYRDPSELYKNYQSHIAASEQFIAPFFEMFLAILGADNEELLKNIPADILSMADEIDGLPEVDYDSLRKKAQDAASDMKSALDTFTPEPLKDTRRAIGFNSGASGFVNSDVQNPIIKIWEKICPDDQGHSIEDFFGDSGEGCHSVGYNRINDVAKCHMMLNMLGYYPDDGLPNREKLPRILADGNHIAFGSLCDCFITADKRAYNKAKAIFEFKEFPSKVGFLKYEKAGMRLLVVDPDVVRLLPESELKDSLILSQLNFLTLTR